MNPADNEMDRTTTAATLVLGLGLIDIIRHTDVESRLRSIYCIMYSVVSLSPFHAISLSEFFKSFFFSTVGSQV